MQKMNKSLGFPIAASSQNESANQSQQDLNKRVNLQSYYNNSGASSKYPPSSQRPTKGASSSQQKKGLKNYSLNEKYGQGFDSDGDRADVEEIDDGPSQPLETSIRQYQTPSKRGPGESTGFKQILTEPNQNLNTMPITTHKRHDSIGRHPPNQGQGEESISEVTRFMDDFYAKRGYFGPGGQNLKKKSNITKGDDYFNSLESLVDKYLTQVAQKIAEKRQLEVENSQLRTNINKVNTDITEGDRAQQKLENDKQKADSQNSNLNIEVSSLKEQLNSVHNKIDHTKLSYKQQLFDLDQHFERMRDSVEDEGCMVANTKNQVQMKKQSMANQIKDLEKKYLAADKASAQLSQKHSYSKHLEDSRISKLRDKAKILQSLMSHQDITHSQTSSDPNKGNLLTKNISKILVSATQSPQRAQATRVSQSASMSIARASINAQKKSFDSNASKYHSSSGNRSALKF